MCNYAYFANVRSSSICLSPSPLVIPFVERTNAGQDQSKAKQSSVDRTFEPSLLLPLRLSQATSSISSATGGPVRWSVQSAMESATTTIRQAASGPRNPAKQSGLPTPSAEPGGGRRLPERRDAIAESKKASAGPRAHFSPLVLLLLVSLRTRGDARIARPAPARDGTPPSTVPEPRNRSPDSNTIPSFRLVNVWYLDRTAPRGGQRALHHGFL